jgi:hypothetical protein
VLRLEAVAEPEVRVDEPALRYRAGQLRPQLVDVHVDGAVLRAQRRAPHGLVELLPRDDAALPPDQRRQQLELAHRQRQGTSLDQREVVVGPDLQIAGAKHLGFLCQLHRPGRLSTLPSAPVTLR